MPLLVDLRPDALPLARGSACFEASLAQAVTANLPLVTAMRVAQLHEVEKLLPAVLIAPLVMVPRRRFERMRPIGGDCQWQRRAEAGSVSATGMSTSLVQLHYRSN